MTKMQKSRTGQRSSLLKGASALAAAAAAFAGTPAIAQDDEEAIVVTGTRIPQPNLYTTSPVTQVTGEDIQEQGVTRVEDLTNELPQVFAGQGSNVSNGASGTATVNLRGLGAARTLVLIDGRRMGYGSPNSTPSDLNQIPGALVERIEVLTGGASAVYGSDAIAGVVNFIMRDDFEGLRLDAQYGFYQHNNDGNDGYVSSEVAYRGATNPAQFQVPDEDQDDGYGKEITAIFGASTADGRGNVTAYLGYRQNDQVLQRDRDYSACALGGQSTAGRPYAPAGTLHWTCGGSSTSFPGRFNDFGLGAGVDFTIDQGTGLFVPFNGNLNQYNYGPLNYYQRPDERYTGGLFARYEINDMIEAYGRFMFSDYRSVSQIAPSGDFFVTGTLNCGNPFLLAANAAAIGCTAGMIAADTPGNPVSVPLYIGRRNVEGGGRQDDLNYTSYRSTVGIRGPLNESWDYDLWGQYYRTAMQRSYLNDLSVSRLTRALDVLDIGGGPVCRSVLNGVDPNCVPWNIFTPGGVTQAALDYLNVPLLQRGEATQQNVVGTVTGDFGWGMPAAETNLQAAFGFEYRRDVINAVVDENFATGNAAGQGGPTLPLTGEIDVFELFAEARLPIVEGASFAELLSVDLAYRYSDYSTGVETDSYKVGAEWAPSEDIRFRGAFQRAVRAANVIELFSAQGFGLFDMNFDPCDDLNDDGLLNNSVPASCIGGAAYQVTAAQSDSGALNSPAGQYNAIFGGEPTLTPEESDTYTFGFVFTPSFLPGFNLSVDYFDIEVTNLVGLINPEDTLLDCYLNATAASCARITRNAGTGQLWVGTGNVRATNTNIGGLQTTGYDINANYSMDIGDMGSLSFSLIGTLLDELSVDPGAATGVAPYDCVGFFSSVCGTPNPEWRHRFRVGWDTPWNIELSGTWRYYDEVTNWNHQTAPGNFLDGEFDAQNYLDLAGNWDIYENTRLRFGVNNVTDEDPPISDNVGAGFGNGNTYPQVYDSLGRWVFAGISVDF